MDMSMVKGRRPMLAGRLKTDKHDRAVEDVVGWYASVKLDGYRCFWDGQYLFSKSGRKLPHPPWFTKGFPSTPLDGELYAGPGTRARLSGITRNKHNPWWGKIRFMVFDMPSLAPFKKRIERLSKYTPKTRVIGKIRHVRVKSIQQLHCMFKATTRHGGEGLVVRKGDTPYKPGVRSRTFLKYKPRGIN